MNETEAPSREAAAALHRAGDLEGAVRLYREFLKQAPADAGGWANLGIALRQLARLAEAETACRRALALDPNHANGGNNLGIVLAAQGRHAEAVDVYRAVLARHPRFHEAWCNLGLSLAAMDQIGEAKTSFGKALALAPGYTEALVQFVYHKLLCCDWEGLDDAIGRLSVVIRADAGAVNPFALLAICRDPEEMLRAARHYAARIERTVKAATQPCPRTREGGRDKLRLGYVSGDFHQHATAVLTAELFEKHDRRHFEVFGYSFGPDTGDPMRKRVIRAFDRFVDISQQSAQQAAKTIREDGIDILIDLKGYTRGARTAIFALRPAPIQVNYLGYPGTMGARFIDYAIADRVVVPPGAESLYSEKIVRLPGSYQPNDSTRPVGIDAPSRASLGLPEQGFVFCCFNQTYKITPDMFAVWMQLLREVPESVLWLVAFNRVAPVRLAALANAAGVDAKRLVFAPKLPTTEHLARLRQADLFLDTHPCGAHTTASDALWAGVPVLTLAGEVLQSRVAASLLMALGLGELVTATLDGYYALARALAGAPDRVAALKAHLAAARRTSELFDGAAIARKLEAAYAAMWKRHEAGLPPEHIDLAGS